MRTIDFLAYAACHFSCSLSRLLPFCSGIHFEMENANGRNKFQQQFSREVSNYCNQHIYMFTNKCDLAEIVTISR